MLTLAVMAGATVMYILHTISPHSTAASVAGPVIHHHHTTSTHPPSSPPLPPPSPPPLPPSPSTHTPSATPSFTTPSTTPAPVARLVLTHPDVTPETTTIAVALRPGFHPYPLTEATEALIAATLAAHKVDLDALRSEADMVVVRVPAASAPFTRDPAVALGYESPHHSGDCFRLDVPAINADFVGLCTPASVEAQTVFATKWVERHGAHWYGDTTTPQVFRIREARVTHPEKVDPPVPVRGEPLIRRLREVVGPGAVGRFPRASMRDLSRAVGRRTIAFVGDSIVWYDYMTAQCVGRAVGDMLEVSHVPPWTVAENAVRSAAVPAHDGLSLDALPDGGFMYRETMPIVKEGIMASLKRVANVVVINLGLHFGDMAKYTEAMQVVFSSFLEWAREDGHVFIFRETSAQHFPSRGGSFRPGDEKAVDTGVCPAVVGGPVVLEHNTIARSIAAELDPGGDAFFFIPYDNMTNELHASHLALSVAFRTDGTTKTHLDCTHHCYSPNRFEMVYAAVADILWRQSPPE